MAGNIPSPEITAEDFLLFQQKEIDVKNALLFGATFNNNISTVKEKIIFEKLKEEKERKQREQREQHERDQRARLGETGGDQFTKWMCVRNPQEGRYCAVSVMLDTGSEENFVTREMISEFGLVPEPIPRMKFGLVNGATFYCDQKVEIAWSGKDATPKQITCFVLPGRSTITKPLLGKEFIQDFGYVLFDEKPPATKLIAFTTQKSQTPQEKDEIEKNLVAAEAKEKENRNKRKQRSRKPKLNAHQNNK